MIRLLACLLSLVTVQTLANQEYRAWLAQQQQAFNHYVDQQQLEFAKWLSQDWIDKDADTIMPDALPKPDQLPALPADTNKAQQHFLTPDFRPVEPSQPEAPQPSPYIVKMQFYGLDTGFDIPASLRKPVSRRADLSGWWKTMAESVTPELLRSLSVFKQTNFLNDWDMLFFLNQLSQQVLVQPNARSAWTWFMGVQLGLDLRLMEGRGIWYVGYNSLQTPVAVPFIRIGQKRYFIFGVQGNAVLHLQTYPEFADFADLQPLNMQMHPKLYLGDQWRDREIEFTAQQSQWHMVLPYNVYRVEHAKVYPQLQLQDYLNTPWPDSLQQAVSQQLRPLVAHMSGMQRWRFLLAMVQQGFPYQTDQQQFGRENYLLAEEMLFYPYSDCEDRSYFLKGVLKAIAPETIIGVRFPNHLALAVLDRDEQVKGYTLSLSGNDYVLLDPSYLNAGPGQLMPALESQKPQAIILN
ncbi:hypothetical protein [Gynuella sp.]|uniref:hypothetical protein n=1 Tax=Gynuella sp. TaxID=2969146 RepID=UPI003D0EF849